jgi:hypothetical protein
MTPVWLLLFVCLTTFPVAETIPVASYDLLISEGCIGNEVEVLVAEFIALLEIRQEGLNKTTKKSQDNGKCST